MDAARVLRGEITVEDLAFKMPADGKIWNTGYYPRPSAVAKVTGTVRYGADMILGMPKDTLHLALAQAEVSHAKILSIDTSEAEKMPGVFKVLTHKDVKGNNRITGLVTFPTNKGDGWDRPILCGREDLPVRRRSRHSLCRHRGEREGSGEEGEAGTGGTCPPI